LLIIHAVKPKAFDQIKGKILKDSLSDCPDLLRRPRFAEHPMEIGMSSITGFGKGVIGYATQPSRPDFAPFIRKGLGENLDRPQGKWIEGPPYLF
jgi:hypothetical protein